MPKARKTLIIKDQASVYHCISRCVPRSYLCGIDHDANTNYEHRKKWVKDRIQELSGIFAMEIYSYAVMSNHFHIVIATNPDRADSWSNIEVIKRWHRLTVASLDENLNFIPLGQDELELRAKDRGLVLKYRERLKCLSHFMQYLNQYIARRANEEDDCKGRFWEGRFKSQRLEDEGAILACMSYVELNPVRAKVVDRPELSEFTSAYDRIVAKRAKEGMVALEQEDFENPNEERAKAFVKMDEESKQDEWLHPFEQRDGSMMPEIDLESYLELIDWTGRAIKEGKKGHIPADLAPILDRLDLDQKEWVSNVKQFGGMFHHFIGKAGSIAKAAERAGQKWAKGMKPSLKLFKKIEQSYQLA